MTLKEMIQTCKFEQASVPEKEDCVLSNPFCCDLLSIAMSRIPANAVWVTVMANMNTLAVATLTDVACIILAEGVRLDAPALEKAKEEKITVLYSNSSIFNTALKVYQAIHA